MSVYVYVDGFNFYYRLYRNRGRRYPIPVQYKWLDLMALARRLAPGEDVDWIGYFTAYVRATTWDPDQHIRQRAYLSALQTIPRLEIVPGNFQPATKWGTPKGQATGHPVRFKTFEEKGSDVNLASRLVWDAARGVFDEAIVLSNDSDLTEAVRIATTEAGRTVHILSPDVTVSNALSAVASTAEPLDTKLLKSCQFPDSLTNQDGVLISRPAAWTAVQSIG